ncbi:MAG: major facilitator superfamily 1 [Bacteroidetes bacterium]|jgi:MFS transporter, DHA1 family, arabinose polymer utilization protein|nr:major facilitator superfamily 1 [Bacteroidota bacterium]
MRKSFMALACGTLCLGMSEFAMMGILPDVARDLHIGIDTAGHFISAYALGVCAGAPMLILARKFKLKYILLVLVTLILIGNLAAAAAPGYFTLLSARFISGIPHGAYFGVGSIVADKLADKGKGSQAIALMVSGMTLANLLGVPLCTSLSVVLSWRLTFLLIGCWSIVTLLFIGRWVPHVAALPDTGFRGQFRFLKSSAPWLLIGATLLGNGGVFAWYSYINPLLRNVSGFDPHVITFLMVLAGLGMVLGNLTGGALSDRYNPARIASLTQACISIILLLIFFLSPISWLSVLLMTLCTTGLFALSSPQQILIIRYSKGGEMLGAACVQIAFNLGNAIGAYCGGLTLHAGLGYRYPALVGVPFALAGCLLLYIFYKRYSSIHQGV